MKYVHKGLFREYWGYVFVGDTPVDITDKATLERIQMEPDFSPVVEPKEKVDEKVQEVQAVEAPAPVLKGKECNVCHKLIPRGWYMHQKYCRVVS